MPSRLWGRDKRNGRRAPKLIWKEIMVFRKKIEKSKISKNRSRDLKSSDLDSPPVSHGFFDKIFPRGTFFENFDFFVGDFFFWILDFFLYSGHKGEKKFWTLKNSGLVRPCQKISKHSSKKRGSRKRLNIHRRVLWEKKTFF